jgi:hypothetical protein
MRLLLALMLGVVCTATACSSKKQVNQDAPQAKKTGPGRTAHPIVEKNLGKRITVEGEPRNLKLGAQLAGDGFELWIKDLDTWPDEVIPRGHTGGRLRVTGILGQDHASPVFVPKEGEPIKTGMPVPEGTDLKKAGHRFVLDQATWERAR